MFLIVKVGFIHIYSPLSQYFWLMWKKSKRKYDLVHAFILFLFLKWRSIQTRISKIFLYYRKNSFVCSFMVYKKQIIFFKFWKCNSGVWCDAIREDHGRAEL